MSARASALLDWVYLCKIVSRQHPRQTEGCSARDDYMPSIYLSMLSHCVLPVERR